MRQYLLFGLVNKLLATQKLKKSTIILHFIRRIMINKHMHALTSHKLAFNSTKMILKFIL